MSRTPSVGIDVVSVARLERALERRPRLADRLFTDSELQACAGRARPGRHLAARFSAKEAVVKALALRAVSPREIEVLGGRDGPVSIDLHGAAAAEARRAGVDVAVSVTHDGDIAAAIAMAVPR